MKNNILTLVVVLLSASSVVAGKGKGAPSTPAATPMERTLRTRSKSAEKPAFDKFTPADKGEEVDVWGFKTNEAEKAEKAKKALALSRAASEQKTKDASASEKPETLPLS
jgi:hypothetical protein